MTTYIFFAVIAILAIILGSVIGSIFSIFTVGSATLPFAIIGSTVAGWFAYDFIKEEIAEGI